MEGITAGMPAEGQRHANTTARNFCNFLNEKRRLAADKFGGDDDRAARRTLGTPGNKNKREINPKALFPLSSTLISIREAFVIGRRCFNVYDPFEPRRKVWKVREESVRLREDFEEWATFANGKKWEKRGH